MTQVGHMKIRAAQEKHYQQVCALFRALDEYHVHLAPNLYQPVDGPPRTQAHYTRLITNPDGYFFVAETEDGLVGFINGAVDGTPPYPMFKPKRFVGVTNLFVQASQRGSGIGLALLQQAREWGLSQGVTAMRLDVIADNETAMRFYEGLGFSQVRSTLEVELAELSSHVPKKI